MEAEKKPFHVQVAEKLITQLEQGTAPFQKPWGDPSFALPMNPTTNKRYKGANTLHLMMQGREDPRWMTYKQAQDIGCQVRQGQSSTTIVHWKFSEQQTLKDDKGNVVKDEEGKPLKVEVRLERPRMSLAWVFNGEQIDGIKPYEAPTPNWNPVQRAEEILANSKAEIIHNAGNRAFYSLGKDSIHLPLKSQFDSDDKYYATALHELGHWTGHETRLNRDLKNPFGSEGYAREELRAEIASMILGEELGIGHDGQQHAAYVGSWIKALKQDPYEIFRAAADAEKIQEYVMQFSNVQQQEVKESIEKIEISPVVEKVIAEVKHVEKVPLNVPFRDNAEAKELGAKWDRKERQWYIQSNMDSAKFSKWMNESALPEKKQKTEADLKPAEMPNKVYLAIPYADRKEAAVAGAKWDRVEKTWYAGKNAKMDILSKYLPENLKHEQLPAMEPKQEFAEEMRARGAIISGIHPKMDGGRHRIAVEGDKGVMQSGFYFGYLDGKPAGYFENNRTGETITWKSKGYSLSEEEKARISAEAKQNKLLHEKEWAEKHEQTSARLQSRMAKMFTPQQPTSYLQSKQLPVLEGILTNRDGKVTIIPAGDANGKIWTMQYIQEDGSKRFAKDSKKDGCFHVIGGSVEDLSKVPAIIISEGYATGRVHHDVLKFPTVVGFDSGNLKAVAMALKEKYPEKPIIIGGDDDLHLLNHPKILRNVGRDKAEEAANAVSGKAFFPTFAPKEQESNPKDFTDSHDLVTRSILGKEGLERQLKAFVDTTLKEIAAIKLQQQKVQIPAQEKQVLRKKIKISA